MKIYGQTKKKYMKKSFLVFAALATMFTSCMNNKETATTFKTEDTDEAVNVKVKKVESRDVAQLVEFTANVQANKVNSIAPQAPVRIREIKAEVGQKVSAGQTLVVMDNTNLNQVKLQLDNARLEFNRIDELFKVGGCSKSQWDQMKTQLDVLESNYNNMVENTTLRSPISGVVSARNYDNGDLYQGQPVLVVQQISPVKLIINVNEQYFKQVSVGMPIDNISLDAYPGETFSGKVSIVYPTLDANTRTFPVEVKIDNANQRVRPGMFARVTLNFGEVNHVCVPDQAIVKQTGSGDRFVYVVGADGRVSYNKVELGRRIDAEYEVISGVEPGSTVVVFGQTLLAAGKKVNILD